MVSAYEKCLFSSLVSPTVKHGKAPPDRTTPDSSYENCLARNANPYTEAIGKVFDIIAAPLRKNTRGRVELLWRGLRLAPYVVGMVSTDDAVELHVGSPPP